MKIKDKYCLCYFGHNAEYVAQLKLIRPFLREKFPDLRIYLSCNDDLFHIINDEEDIVDKTKLYRNKRAFGYIDEIRWSMKKSHPIKTFLEKSNLNVPRICQTSEIKFKKCIITNKANLPTKPVDKNQINDIAKKIQAKGFSVIQIPTLEDLKDVGWVIGVENEFTYLSAAKGVKTTLISTGIGNDVFKTMFPKAEIVKPTNLNMIA